MILQHQMFMILLNIMFFLMDNNFISIKINILILMILLILKIKLKEQY